MPRLQAKIEKKNNLSWAHRYEMGMNVWVRCCCAIMPVLPSKAHAIQTCVYACHTVYAGVYVLCRMVCIRGLTCDESTHSMCGTTAYEQLYIVASLCTICIVVVIMGPVVWISFSRSDFSYFVFVKKNN